MASPMRAVLEFTELNADSISVPALNVLVGHWQAHLAVTEALHSITGSTPVEYTSTRMMRIERETRMFTEATNSKKQGDVGLGCAISYFTANGYTVCLPLTDRQDYDLVVEKGDSLKKVQVKTTSHKPKLSYEVELRTLGDNRSWSDVVINFDQSRFDFLFVLTTSGEKYLIPSEEISVKSTITLGEKYSKYKV